MTSQNIPHFNKNKVLKIGVCILAGVGIIEYSLCSKYGFNSRTKENTLWEEYKATVDSLDINKPEYFHQPYVLDTNSFDTSTTQNSILVPKCY